MTTMTTTGNFIAYTNRDKKPGDQRPVFQGRISIPGSEKEYSVALWGNKDKNNKTYFSGRTSVIALNDDSHAQIESLIAAGAPAINDGDLKLDANEVLLFTNRFKDEANPKRPDYWGRWNPGQGEQLINISAWLAPDRYNRPRLAGSCSYPVPGVDAAKVEAAVEITPDTNLFPAEDAKPARRSRSAGR